MSIIQNGSVVISLEEHDRLRAIDANYHEELKRFKTTNYIYSKVSRNWSRDNDRDISIEVKSIEMSNPEIKGFLIKAVEDIQTNTDIITRDFIQSHDQAFERVKELSKERDNFKKANIFKRVWIAIKN